MPDDEGLRRMVLRAGDRPRHRCDLPPVPQYEHPPTQTEGFQSVDMINAIARCTVCSRRYVSREDPDAWGFHARWVPLRWWHLRARRALAADGTEPRPRTGRTRRRRDVAERCCGEGDPATCVPPCSREVARATESADSRAEAREQIAAWMARHFTEWDAMPEQNREAWREDADRFIASCPVVAEGLAAQEALRRVEALAEEWDAAPYEPSLGYLGVAAERLRRIFGDHP